MSSSADGTSGRPRSHPWHDLSPGASAPEEITVVVETPATSRNKYELDKASGLFKLDRVLHSSVHYPGDYGFVPQTLFDDGDPLDVVVLVKEPTFAGCLLTARPLGILRMTDRGEPDDKILAVPTHDPHQMECFDIADIPRHMLREIEYFFGTYKALEGKAVGVLGWEKSEVAMREITRSITRYGEVHGRRQDTAALNPTDSKWNA
jgi:Inorganic pyrophosphatase